MTKKRRSLSLQAILVPSFLSPVTSPTSPTFPADSNYFIPPVTSPRASSPPSYLLDDDPFANLTAAPSEVQRTPQSPPQLKSPLIPDRVASIPAVKSPTHSRASSSKSFAARAPVPASQKPAFAPKPSLPSLDTLSRMNIVLPKKLRKGRVGAGLPFEPWDNPEAIPGTKSRISPTLSPEEVEDQLPTSPTSSDSQNLPSFALLSSDDLAFIQASATITNGIAHSTQVKHEFHSSVPLTQAFSPTRANLEPSEGTRLSSSRSSLSNEDEFSDQQLREVIDDARPDTPVPRANVDSPSNTPDSLLGPGTVVADSIPDVTPTPTPVHVSTKEFTSSIPSHSHPSHANVAHYYAESEHVEDQCCEPEPESTEEFDLVYATVSPISPMSPPPRSASLISALFSSLGDGRTYQTDAFSVSTASTMTSESSESTLASPSVSASASASALSFSLSRSTSTSNTISSRRSKSSGSRSPSAASSTESSSLLVVGGVPLAVDDDNDQREEDDVDEAILSLYSDDQPQGDVDVNPFEISEGWRHAISDVGRYGNQYHETDDHDIDSAIHQHQQQQPTRQVIDGINIANVGMNLDLVGVAAPLPYAGENSVIVRGEVGAAVDGNGNSVADPDFFHSSSLLPLLPQQPQLQPQQSFPPQHSPAPLQRNLSSSSADDCFSSLGNDDYPTSLSLSSSSTATATAAIVKQTQYEYSSFVEAITDWRDATHREARDTTTTTTSTNTNGGINAGISSPSSSGNLEPGIVTSDFPERLSPPHTELHSEVTPISELEEEIDVMLASYSSSSHRLPGSPSSKARSRTTSSVSASSSASSRGRTPRYVVTAGPPSPSNRQNNQNLDHLQQQENGYYGDAVEYDPYCNITINGYDRDYTHGHGRSRGQSTGGASANVSGGGGAASRGVSSYDRSGSGNLTNGNYGVRTSGRLSSGSSSVVEDEDGYNRRRGHSQSQGRQPSAFTGPPPSSFSLPLPPGSGNNANAHNHPAVRHSSSVSGGNVTINTLSMSSFSSEGERGDDEECLAEREAGGEKNGLVLPSPSASPTTSTLTTATTISLSSSSSSDDVPLAKSIPTALTAQRSIRRQVREERDQRRRERAGTSASATSATSSTSRGGDRDGEREGVRSRQTTLRPTGAGGLNVPLGVYSSSHEAAIHAVHGASGSGVISRSGSRTVSVGRSTTVTSTTATATANKIVGRPRTQTLPGRATPPFSADDLTKKLQDVQGTSTTASNQAHGRHPSGASATAAGNVDTYATVPPAVPTLPVEVAQSTTRTLRPQRSFHRPSTRPATASDDYKSIALPPNAIQVTQQQPHQLHRAKSQGRLRTGDDFHHNTLKPSYIEDVKGVPPVPAVPRISEEHKRLGREPSLRSAASARPSLESSNGGGYIGGGTGGGVGGGGVERRSSSRRPSTADRDRTGQQRPPVPPLPPSVAAETTGVTPRKSAQVTQQRVFIGDMQSYNVVGIEDSTSAGDVIEMLESRGSLKGWLGSGEWMVWEVAHDFGLERPIRNYERLNDVQASWNKDKLVNMFVARLTTLAPLLARSAIPSSSPIYSGYVEWESKRGKWSKRWLQLREHSLWISKRDNGKDEALLCSLSNFDAYHFTRPCKSPKPFAFALKSTDKLSFFENTQDYKHVISCSERDGKVWMEKILLARSYVLHQERNVLFNPKSYGGQPTVAGNHGTLSRAATSRRPTQPLISVANNNLFEPGSLLHRQG